MCLCIYGWLYLYISSLFTGQSLHGLKRERVQPRSFAGVQLGLRRGAGCVAAGGLPPLAPTLPPPARDMLLPLLLRARPRLRHSSPLSLASAHGDTQGWALWRL